MSNYELKVNNKKLYDFYKSNPNINFESMNLVLLDFIERLGSDINKTLTESIFKEILSDVRDIKANFNNLNSEFFSKMQEYNKDFKDNLTLLINKESTREIDEITKVFVEQLKENIPKSQEQSNQIMQTKLNEFQDNINTEIKEFISSSNSKDNINEFFNNIDKKLLNIQNPIHTLISNNQSSITEKIDKLKEETISNKSQNEKIHEELLEFLNKYKTSSQFKGQCSENLLQNVINEMFPTADVINTTSSKASGDFIFKRTGKQDIMIENKNYEVNVNKEEVEKFLRDINIQKTHGIMMSQLSGIVFKPNGYIEINDGKVIIYLHNVNYSKEKIKMAIDVIDNLSERIKDITATTKDEGYKISKDMLDKINDEFQKFMNQKEQLSITLKEMNKKMSSLIEEIKMPNLAIYLSDKFASIQNQQFICDICQMPFNNKRSLASHKKCHKVKS